MMVRGYPIAVAVVLVGSVRASSATASALSASAAAASDPATVAVGYDEDGFFETRRALTGRGRKKKKKTGKKKKGKTVVARPRRLQIIHSSDNESSFVDPNTLENKMSNFAAVVKALKRVAVDGYIPSVHVTAGDFTLPGPFYQAAAEVPELGQPGLGTIEMFNAMGHDADGIGNHEFDGGINEFAHMVAAASFPFLSVNIDFSEVELQDGTPTIKIAKDGSRCDKIPGMVAKSCHLKTTIGLVGLIGRAPADLFNIVEDPDMRLPGLDFVGGRDPDTNQPLVSAVGQVLEQVELLAKYGVDIIVLLDHAQDFTSDPLSASLLSGIDVIVSAGSTGFQGNELTFGPYNTIREGDTTSGTYPVVRTDSDGENVLIINTEQLYRYAAHLIVDFDENGKVVSWDCRSGPLASTDTVIGLFQRVLGAEAERNNEVDAILAKLDATDTIQGLFDQVGMTSSALNGLRADVRSRETNLGRLVADSTIWGGNEYAGANGLPAVDVGFKNGGGIRDSIVGPSIIKLTINSALAFNNKLTLLQLTVPQMIAAFENSVSRAQSSDGRFPQLAGATLEYDPTKAGVESATSLDTPSRVKSLVITKSDSTTDTLVDEYTAQGDLSRTFVIATNSFLASGGDGYAAFAAATVLAEETDVGEQQILADYIVQVLNEMVNIPDPPENPRTVQV